MASRSQYNSDVNPKSSFLIQSQRAPQLNTNNESGKSNNTDWRATLAEISLLTINGSIQESLTKIRNEKNAELNEEMARRQFINQTLAQSQLWSFAV
ncbi:hypothetical protein EMCG_07745 [[Emmonsia] crescens]|uniref:Uncharacterized protein n=1 Tax=[Emmonsia] crescens TaxID=73230 RepID=A0A0G2JAY1_9EURO|nr:hypothetical protein EMCG_07745 [Emmonsia crescens UAMH 3008]